MTTPQPAAGRAEILRRLYDKHRAFVDAALADVGDEPDDLADMLSASAADRVETAARVLHERRHRAGYSHVCDACRDDARAVAAALIATEENAR